MGINGLWNHQHGAPTEPPDLELQQDPEVSMSIMLIIPSNSAALYLYELGNQHIVDSWLISDS